MAGASARIAWQKGQTTAIHEKAAACFPNGWQSQMHLVSRQSEKKEVAAAAGAAAAADRSFLYRLTA